jgi:hypothetical protein
MSATFWSTCGVSVDSAEREQLTQGRLSWRLLSADRATALVPEPTHPVHGAADAPADQIPPHQPDVLKSSGTSSSAETVASGL